MSKSYTSEDSRKVRARRVVEQMIKYIDTTKPKLYQILLLIIMSNFG